MAYLNRNKVRALEVLTLRMKVSAKNHGELRVEKGSDRWHSTWDVAEYAHCGILALLGSGVAKDRLLEAAKHNDAAQGIVFSIESNGVSL